jgi:hypothetical protein
MTTRLGAVPTMVRWSGLPRTLTGHVVGRVRRRKGASHGRHDEV